MNEWRKDEAIALLVESIGDIFESDGGLHGLEADFSNGGRNDTEWSIDHACLNKDAASRITTRSKNMLWQRKYTDLHNHGQLHEPSPAGNNLQLRVTGSSIYADHFRVDTTRSMSQVLEQYHSTKPTAQNNLFVLKNDAESHQLGANPMFCEDRQRTGP